MGWETQEHAFGLHWGIKRSFVEYVRAMPDGKIAVGRGAEIDGDGDVAFPPLRAARRVTPDGVDERIWDFAGDVCFSGHFGLLFLPISFPSVRVRDGVGELSIVHPYESEQDKRLILADVALESVPAGPGLRWRSISVRLNPAAGDLFNRVYPAGEVLDPLTVVLPDR